MHRRKVPNNLRYSLNSIQFSSHFLPSTHFSSTYNSIFLSSEWKPIDGICGNFWLDTDNAYATLLINIRNKFIKHFSSNSSLKLLNCHFKNIDTDWTDNIHDNVNRFHVRIVAARADFMKIIVGRHEFSFCWCDDTLSCTWLNEWKKAQLNWVEKRQSWLMERTVECTANKKFCAEKITFLPIFSRSHFVAQIKFVI